MMAVLWKDIERDLALSRHHFSKAVELFRLVQATSVDYAHTMAFMHAMLAGYTSFEAGMKRLLSMLQEPLPTGSDWHIALVHRLAEPEPNSRPAILDTEPLVAAVNRLRGFRHVAMHLYDDFDEERAALAVRAAEVFLVEFDPALARFRAVIDPD